MDPVVDFIEQPSAEPARSEPILDAWRQTFNSTRELLDRLLFAVSAALDLYVGNTLIAPPDKLFLPRYFEVITSAFLGEFSICYELTNSFVDIDGTSSNFFAFRVPYLQAEGMLKIIGAVQERRAVSEAIGNIEEKSVYNPQGLAGLDVVLHPVS